MGSEFVARRLAAVRADWHSEALARLWDAYDQAARKLAKDRGIAIETATEIIESRTEGKLLKDFDVLEMTDGRNVSVAEILDSIVQGEKLPCADPVEGRAYGRTTAAVIWIRETGSPWFWLCFAVLRFDTDVGDPVGPCGCVNALFAPLDISQDVFAPENLLEDASESLLGRRKTLVCSLYGLVGIYGQ